MGVLNLPAIDQYARGRRWDDRGKRIARDVRKIELDSAFDMQFGILGSTARIENNRILVF